MKTKSTSHEVLSKLGAGGAREKAPVERFREASNENKKN